MHPYINQQLIDDRHRRLQDEADAHRLLTPPRPRRRWLHRSQRLAAVPPEIEATAPPPSVVADDPDRPAA
jgi:hypothetical protein